MFCFYAYGQVSQKLKKIHHNVFSNNKENFKKYVLACILALIISLLKPQELGQYFKNSEKKLFCFFF
jgi:hypothetical protein